MSLKFLPSTEEDFRWINLYYGFHFPEGRKPAMRHIASSIRLLLLTTEMGRPYKKLPKRRHLIPKTPFVIYYQVNGDDLEIMRVWDTRRNIEYLTFNGTDK